MVRNDVLQVPVHDLAVQCTKDSWKMLMFYKCLCGDAVHYVRDSQQS